MIFIFFPWVTFLGSSRTPGATQPHSLPVLQAGPSSGALPDAVSNGGLSISGLIFVAS